jgi:uncharacterized protein with GYD domain
MTHREEAFMPKYLVQASYRPDGAKGLLKDGGAKRRAAVDTALKSVGGSLEAFYFAFGSDDVVVVFDAPDHASAVAFSLAVNAAGGSQARTSVLLTPEEMDEATGKSIDYSPPGA